MLNWQPQYQLYRRLDIPEIQDLNVLPAMRRNGVASAMIGFAEKLARENGRTQIGISFGPYPNYGPAQRLYIRLGYIPDGYGVTYDRVTVRPGESRPVDDSLCLMLVKDLADG
jgi:GNAT superfamily N-acetyltransferase